LRFEIKQKTFHIKVFPFNMVINDSILDEVLNYLDDSMNTLFLQNDFTELDGLKKNFEVQYDIRLESLLRGKASSIHHLESGMKNKIIMRKQRLLNRLKEEFQKKKPSKTKYSLQNGTNNKS